MESTQRIDHYAPPEDKIRLFRSLFRGREDVYPRRFESRRTGKAGYSPACANEWIKGVCEKPKVKCSNCRFQNFLPITDDVIRFHLSGHDETCFFIAADFDKATWLDDARAFLGTCRSLQIPAILERSRSGSGGPTIQSLVKKGTVDETIARYGHLVVDECHHLSAYSFEQVARSAKARFVTGLSATVTRKDGHHPIIFMQCGPVRHRVDVKAQAASRPFDHLVMVRPTGFRALRVPNADLRVQYSELMEELISAEARTRQICRDVTRAVQDGRSPIVLTERNDHLDLLAELLSPDVQHLVVLRGGMGSKEVAKIRARLAAIPDSEGRLLLATGRYAGEGFDDGRLDTLFLTLPVSWRGTIAQYVGRLHRLRDGKREVRVYDYADLDVPMLARMFDRRCKGYEAVGYTIRLPGSAMPGWPPEIELPDDSLWRSEYAASARRLALDGVDVPLTELFARAAANLSTAEDGPSRARSAGEQFLFRRLETLPQTSGRFRLNAELPIPFDGWGRMEVDLLCEDARIAVELDGAQHLENTEAYRRDRHKDAVLQEHGYFVLRFLAEDVTKRLDDVLHGILRALAHRSRRPPASERPSLFKIV